MPFDLEDRLIQTPQPARQPLAPMRELQSSGDIRILILDDDPATCSVIQAALSNRDFLIDVVSDPQLVESALAQPHQYHLIVLDYVLPGLEPDQVFAWIRDTQPDIVLFGHVHHPLAQRTRIGRTECVNVGHFRGTGTPYALAW